MRTAIMIAIIFAIGSVGTRGAHAQNYVDTGDTACRWGGEACNRCVVDVERQFSSIIIKGVRA